MSVCKWHHEDGVRFLVPGCWNRVIYGDSAECHCVESEEESLRKQVRDLQDQVAWMKLQMQGHLPPPR